MLKKVVLASNNKGKLKELKKLLSPYDVEVISQSELNVEDVEEDGLTFIENAIIKARHASAATGLPAIADDSGLEVDALEGRPGIYSARYAGEERTTQSYCDRLLKELRFTPEGQRGAQFRSVVVFMKHANDPSPLIGQGQWAGEIIFEMRGENGFGYDPVFYLADRQKTVAELTPDLKNSLSHRAHAMQDLIEQLKDEKQL